MIRVYCGVGVTGFADKVPHGTLTLLVGMHNPGAATVNVGVSQKLKTELPYDPADLLLDLHPKNQKLI